MKRLLPCLAALFAVLVVAAPARAADAHPYLGILVGGTQPAQLRDACGVAADGEGNRYLADYYHSRLEIFNYQGLPSFSVSQGRLTASGKRGELSENQAADPICGLAVDSAGRLYGNLWHGAVVRYQPSQYPFPNDVVPGYGAPVSIDSGPATGVAVDPATNRLYVAHRTYVAAYEPNGSPVIVGGHDLHIGEGSGHDYYGLAVSSFPGTSGRLYVADAAAGTIEAFDPAADPENPVQTIDAAATPQGEFVGLVDTSLAIDASDGHLLVVDDLGGSTEHPTAVVDEFGPGGEYVGQLPQPIVFARPSGLAVDNSPEATRGLVYVTSGDEEESKLLAFCPASPGTSLAGLCPPAAPTKLLSLIKGGAGSGTVVTPSGPIACGVLCAWEFEAGSTVTLAATPSIGSTFVGWSVAGTPGACTGTGTCQLTLGEDTEVTAMFVPAPQRTLTVHAAGTGQGVVYSEPSGIWCGNSCEGIFEEGAQVTLLADPAPGSRFAGWSGSGCTGSGGCKVTVDADAAIGAEFEAVVEAPPFSPSPPAIPAEPSPAASPAPAPPVHRRHARHKRRRHHRRHHHHKGKR